jgi:hypothetical protein
LNKTNNTSSEGGAPGQRWRNEPRSNPFAFAKTNTHIQIYLYMMRTSRNHHQREKGARRAKCETISARGDRAKIPGAESDAAATLL